MGRKRIADPLLDTYSKFPDNVNLVNPYSFAGGDADALDYFARIVTAGGSIDAGTKSAVTTFVVAAKANSYWTKLLRINVFMGADLTSALVPLKVGGGNTTDTNHNFTGGNYTTSTGITGDGSTKYLETGIVPSTMLTANSTHLSAYFTNTSSGADNGMGAGIFPDYLVGNMPYSDGVYYSDQYDFTNGRVSGTPAAQSGWYVGSRTASNVNKCYRNATELGSASTSGGTLGNVNINIFVFAKSNNGTAQQFVNKAIGAYSIGSGLSGSDVTAMNTDLEALMDAVSRGVQ